MLPFVGGNIFFYHPLADGIALFSRVEEPLGRLGAPTGALQRLGVRLERPVARDVAGASDGEARPRERMAADEFFRHAEFAAKPRLGPPLTTQGQHDAVCGCHNLIIATS